MPKKGTEQRKILSLHIKLISLECWKTRFFFVHCLPKTPREEREFFSSHVDDVEHIVQKWNDTVI